MAKPAAAFLSGNSERERGLRDKQLELPANRLGKGAMHYRFMLAGDRPDHAVEDLKSTLDRSFATRCGARTA